MYNPILIAFITVLENPSKYKALHVMLQYLPTDDVIMQSCPPVGADVVLEFRIEDEPLCRLAYLAIYVSHTVSIVELNPFYISALSRENQIFMSANKKKKAQTTVWKVHVRRYNISRY